MADADPKTCDWGRVFAEAVALASTFTKRDAEDVVQEAMRLHFEGEAPYDPAQGATLAQHLVSVGMKARSNRARIERRRNRPKFVTTLRLLFGGGTPTPQEATLAAEEERRKETLYEKLVADLAADPIAREVALLERQGVTEAAEQRTKIGCDIETVRNARKRVKRRAEAIAEHALEEEAIAEQALEQEAKP